MIRIRLRVEIVRKAMNIVVLSLFLIGSYIFFSCEATEAVGIDVKLVML